MSWAGIVGLGMTAEQLREHVAGLKFGAWRPSFMVLHNTGAPTLAQWHSTAGAQRMKNLENYYKNEQGWSSGPHAFVADDLIWPFTPFTAKGTHTPSWNGTSLGIELVGDYSREDDDAGPGLKAKMNAVACFAILHERLGLDPHTIRLHREDARTTHKDCPGKDIDKTEFIGLVEEYMGQGGEHPSELPITPPAPSPVARSGVANVPVNDVLNVRAGSSASSAIVAKLPKGTKVSVLGEAMNGATKWFRVRVPDGKEGFASARFVTTSV